VIETASAPELLELAHDLVKDACVVRIPGPAYNEVRVTKGFSGIDSLGMYAMTVTLMTREYVRNGRIRKAARRIFGERRWVDASISCHDLNNPVNNRDFQITESLSDVVVVVGESHGDTEMVVRQPNSADVAALNQALAFMTLGDAS